MTNFFRHTSDVTFIYNNDARSSLGDLMMLEVLNLSNNQLSGQVPDEIGDLRNLDELNLSSGKLLAPRSFSFNVLVSFCLLEFSSIFELLTNDRK